MMGTHLTLPRGSSFLPISSYGFNPTKLSYLGAQFSYYNPQIEASILCDPTGQVKPKDGSPVFAMLDNAYNLSTDGVELSLGSLSDKTLDGWSISASYSSTAVITKEANGVQLTSKDSKAINSNFAQISTPPISTVVGQVYKFAVTLDLAKTSSGYWLMFSDSPATDTANRRQITKSTTTANMKSTYTGYFLASATKTYLNFTIPKGELYKLVVTDISVQLLHGNHLWQGDSTLQPTYKLFNNKGVLDFNGTSYLSTTLNNPFKALTGITTVDDITNLDNSIRVVWSTGVGGYSRIHPTTFSLYPDPSTTWDGDSTVAIRVDNNTTEVYGTDSLTVTNGARHPFGTVINPIYLGTFNAVHTGLRPKMYYRGGLIIDKYLTINELTKVRNFFMNQR